MKPKDRLYCNDCGKRKIRFDTEDKAKNFIKYNWKELTDNKKTLRSYYCISCGCWHITSSQNKKCKSVSEKVIHNYKHENDKVNKARLERQKEIETKKVQRYLSEEAHIAYVCLRDIGIYDKIYVHEYCKQHNLDNEVRTIIGELAKKERDNLKTKNKHKYKK